MPMVFMWCLRTKDGGRVVAASYKISIAYDAVPINRGKQILEDYYITIWNAIYINSANASHTQLFIPTIFHRLSLTL